MCTMMVVTTAVAMIRVEDFMHSSEMIKKKIKKINKVKHEQWDKIKLITREDYLHSLFSKLLLTEMLPLRFTYQRIVI